MEFAAGLSLCFLLLFSATLVNSRPACVSLLGYPVVRKLWSNCLPGLKAELKTYFFPTGLPIELVGCIHVHMSFCHFLFVSVSLWMLSEHAHWVHWYWDLRYNIKVKELFIIIIIVSYQSKRNEVMFVMFVCVCVCMCVCVCTFYVAVIATDVKFNWTSGGL